MGVAANVGFSKSPRQGDWLGRRCEVCFHYDTKNRVGAICVRDDYEEPWVTIFRPGDGRFVPPTEGQHTGPE